MEVKKERNLHAFYSRILLTIQRPWGAALVALLIYGLFSNRAGLLEGPPVFNYYNYLADAFLHGQLNLRILPQTTHDLSFFGGNYYLYWPPMPGILLMPFVAIWGVDFHAQLFTLIVAVINVALIAAVLESVNRRGIIDLLPEKRGLLVIFFAFGTVHFGLAPFGNVWQIGQVVSFAFTATAYLSAISLEGRKAFLITGAAIAAASLTRTHLFLVGLWPAYELLRRHWSRGRFYLASASLLAIAPLVLAGFGMAAYNNSRFGSSFDFGLEYHQMAERFVSDYALYGPFNLHYLPHNLYYHFISYPIPLREDSLEGGSLLLMSPVFFGLFSGLYNQRRNLSAWVMLFSVILTYVPIGLLMGTGWVQWGPRYTLDFSIPLLLLTAYGVYYWSNQVLFGLVYFSMLNYLIGAMILSGVF